MRVWVGAGAVGSVRFLYLYSPCRNKRTLTAFPQIKSKYWLLYNTRRRKRIPGNGWPRFFLTFLSFSSFFLLFFKKMHTQLFFEMKTPKDNTHTGVRKHTHTELPLRGREAAREIRENAVGAAAATVVQVTLPSRASLALCVCLCVGALVCVCVFAIQTLRALRTRFPSINESNSNSL